MLKRFIGVTSALALMAPVGVAMAKPAGAAPIVTCAKPSGAVTFTPGLSDVPKVQTTKFNLPVKNCKGTGGVKSGTSTGSTKGTTKETCLTFGSNPSGVKTKVTIKWNTGKSSVATLSTVVKPATGGLTATVSGKISTGEFKGKTIKTKVKVTLKGKCSTASPLKKAVLTGLAPLTIG
jgi:hypothetical protein